MALEPKLTDYVSVIMQLFEQFMQHRIDKQGVTPAKSLTYSTGSFIIFFMLMQFRDLWFQNAMAVANQSPRSVANARLATATASNHHCPSL